MRNSENRLNYYFIKHKLCKEANDYIFKPVFSWSKQAEVLYNPCYSRQITWIFVPNQYIKNTSFILTVAILLYKVSYLYTSSRFSLLVLVAIEEIVNLTKPTF